MKAMYINAPGEVEIKDIDRCHIGVCPLFEIHSDIHNSGI